MASYALVLAIANLLPFLAFGGGGFSVDLIHRDSPESPLFDPTSTPLSRLRSAVERTRARADYFNIATARAVLLKRPININDVNYDTDHNIQSEIFPNSFEYLMKLYLGTPAEETLAIADTGSDLIWVQCEPCDECYHQKPPLFNPQSSSTYKVVSCNADACSVLPQSGCGSGTLCQYQYVYGDQSYVLGNLATETFSFDSGARSAGRRRVQVPKVMFGCTHESNGTFESAGGGLVGLGGGQLSLITQLGDAIDHKFSYCLPPFDKNSSSRLNFGSMATVSGPGAVSTPIIRGDPETFFFLNLEQISVGDGKNDSVIAVKPRQSTGSITWTQGNIIIDSGTTLTLIDDESLQSLVRKLTKIISLPKVSDPLGVFSLCFDVSGATSSEISNNVPDITFHFSGADVVLKPLNSFVKTEENTLCLAFVSSGEIGGGGNNIFGNIAQQNFNIGYDLRSRKLTIAPADCTNI
ncbi:Aspartic proteinase CDR1 [Apostasia shenzhenica]|uniref:Aspartic proteinase CDR1 n=1 Tax=Apostasia shenzhenica TaxID=1088818 RepID=A0A2H9ZRR9_9ASPA|nr:Aspartic proteinase CDR1 [Apostasia shenzhenica]